MNDSLERDLVNTTSAMSSQISHINTSNRIINASNSSFLSSANEEKSTEIRQEKVPLNSQELNSANRKVEEMDGDCKRQMTRQNTSGALE